MVGCIGFLDYGTANPALDVLRREIPSSRIIFVPHGNLLMVPGEELPARLPLLLETIRAHPACRHVLTSGEFNASERPYYYDLYSQFSNNAPPGELLLCAEVCALLGTEARLIPAVDYRPFFPGVLAGMDRVDTPFGSLELSRLWYSSRNSHLLDATQRFEGMTHPREMKFWETAEGFRYLAQQAALIKAYHTRSRRIVVYTAPDVVSEKFLRLVTVFESIGIELAFIYEDDFAAFVDQQDLGDVEIFARSGNHSLVTAGGKEYFSDDPQVALAISDAQNELLAEAPALRTVKEFIEKHNPDLSPQERADIQGAGQEAALLFTDFNSRSTIEQNIVINSLLEKWGRVCGR